MSERTDRIITVKEASETTLEAMLVENYDFVVSERSRVLFVSTKRNEGLLQTLPGFSLLYAGGMNKVKRFCVPFSKEEFVEQLRKIYPGHAISLIA